ncbi:MAG: hypothetical protein H6741_10435 [Alphaproteobacteria bacterium]|nr:hypothetical protein [Alphaproteobacteria bacterium]
MLGLLCLLLGCWPTPTPESDAELYLEATQRAANDPSGAIELCVRIRAPEEAGDCVLFAARSASSRGEDGLALCAQAGAPQWRDACVFELTDLAGLVGEEGRAACARSGTYASNCIAHLVQREVDALLEAAQPGSEPELLASLQALIHEELPGHDAAREAVVLTAAVIAARTQERFSATQCGAAAPETCALAYEVLAIWTAGGSPISTLCPDQLPPRDEDAPELTALCAGGADPDLARELGRWRMRGRRPGSPYGPTSPFFQPTPAPSPPAR